MYSLKILNNLTDADKAEKNNKWKKMRCFVTIEQLQENTECFECGQKDKRHYGHCQAYN